MGAMPSQPVVPLDDKSQFMIKTRCRGVTSALIVIGLHSSDPILQTIVDSLTNLLRFQIEVKPEKHGDFVTTFKLSENIFGSHVSFDKATTGKIAVTKIFENLLNKHQFRPICSSDLSRYVDHSTFFMERIESENTINSDLCCVAMSSYNKIRLVCLPQHDYLFEALQSITNAVMDAKKYSIGDTESQDGYNIHTLKFSNHLWSITSNEYLTLGRFLIGRIIFHFGKANGWNFLVNGNVKDTSDYIWFAKEKHSYSMFPEKSLSGFEVPFNADCAIFTPNSTDKLRLINFPERVVQPIIDLITTNWGALQRHTPNADIKNCHELKFKGNLWWCSGLDAVLSRVLVMKIMTFLLSQGLRPRTSIDVSRKVRAKGLIIFCPCEPIITMETLILSPTDTDHFRVIGHISADVEFAIKTAAAKWPHGTKTEGYQDDITSINPDQKCYFMDFNGSPWGAYNMNERLHGRMIIQSLLSSLKSLGWTLLISADVSAKAVETKDAQYSIDCHAIFLVKTSERFTGEHMQFDNPDPPSYLEAMRQM